MAWVVLSSASCSEVESSFVEPVLRTFCLTQPFQGSSPYSALPLPAKRRHETRVRVLSPGAGEADLVGSPRAAGWKHN